jgi:para-aminobenzoate synthetase component 1
MRERIPLGTFPFRAGALKNEEHFLFRRVADRDRMLLGVGVLEVADEPVFNETGVSKDWWFGHASYGWKDELEPLLSRHADAMAWPSTRWFRPKWVIEWKEEVAWLHARSGDVQEGLRFIERMRSAPAANHAGLSKRWSPGTSREHYLEQAERLMHHIHRGDIYEVNYCVMRRGRSEGFDPFAAFEHLLKETDAPFAAFYRAGHRFALCASPERFLAFDGKRVTAEPMKGTRPRGRSIAEDAALADELATDAKERSENVMAVDVMRNDLSRTAAPSSVRVEALCAVRSYPRVHQLVSTVVSERAAGRSPWDVVRAAFPMASMTGAPKIRAMQLIDVAEDQARGLYSGTLGFFAPDGTGDLNVVIRTIMHDASSGNLSLHTGSALTAQCDSAVEWEECELKFNSIANA